MGLEVREMVAGADVCHQSIPVLDVPYRCGGAIGKGGDLQTVEEIGGPPPSVFCEVRAPDGVGIGAASVVAQMEPTEDILPSVIIQFVPRIRSGSFADIGHKRTMEDEHIRIDDLAAHLGSSCLFPTPSAFFGVFDGHGGPDCASYLRKNAVRLFFKDAGFPQTFQLEEELEDSVRRAFLLADLALADECNASSSSGTTALTALILGRLLLVANAGDCRAVLCRNGKAVEMSQDHRPIHAGERRRVEEAGGFVEGDYLNGVLSVTRALGDWYMKLPPPGSPLPSSSLSVPSCPLIAEPEFRHAILSEADEFLVLGCDGIWEVMSSQNAVNAVRWGLRRHNDPERCARDLVMEALRLGAFDNLTVIVVCLSSGSTKRRSECGEGPRLKPCRLSREAVCRLKMLLEDGGR